MGAKEEVDALLRRAWSASGRGYCGCFCADERSLDSIAVWSNGELGKGRGDANKVLGIVSPQAVVVMSVRGSWRLLATCCLRK